MPEVSKSKYTTFCGYKQAPHLDQSVLEELIEATPMHLREARFEGIPSVSEGAIYPFHPSEISCEPFPIPEHWPRAYGMDVGFHHPTAVTWGAIDRDSGVHYIYATYKRGKVEPPIHARAIQVRGEWIPGVIDPAGTDITDGTRVMTMYQELGLNVIAADKSVESGLLKTWQMLSTGELKIFSNLDQWFAEQRFYRREIKKNDKTGVEHATILKKNDDLLDATRYLINNGFKRAIVRPVQRTGSPRHRGDDVVGY